MCIDKWALDGDKERSHAFLKGTRSQTDMEFVQNFTPPDFPLHTGTVCTSFGGFGSNAYLLFAARLLLLGLKNFILSFSTPFF